MTDQNWNEFTKEIDDVIKLSANNTNETKTENLQFDVVPISKTENEVANFDLRLAETIISCHPDGFIGAIIEGERGYGKSMYALKVMAQVYLNLENLDENDAWQKALDSMLFSMADVIKNISSNIHNDVVTPVWCLDDATVHFCSYKFFTHLHEVILVHGLFDTLRTAVSGLLLTCPKRSLLLKALRNYDDFTIQISKLPGGNGYRRVAKGVKWYSLPSGKRRFKKLFEDHYNCYVPDWIYAKYMAKRKYYLETINLEMENLIREKIELAAAKRRKQFNRKGRNIETYQS